MGIQYQPICDVIAMLAESAREIADDFFMHHTRVDERMAGGPGVQSSKRPSLVAEDAIGRDQQRQLSKLFDDIDRLSGSTYASGEFRERTQACRQIYLDGMPYRDFAHNHNAAFREFASQIIQIAREMPDDTPGDVLLVPDIGALLEFPEFENWTFPQFPMFNLVLPSTLIGELEELQRSALDQETWKKCALAIRHLQDYRGRGCWNKGIFLTESGSVTLHVLPLEPVFDAAVNWLDPTSPEDRVVARIVALIREHPRCVVALVTRDIHVQNKADDSRIDTTLPPAPQSEQASG